MSPTDVSPDEISWTKRPWTMRDLDDASLGCCVLVPTLTCLHAVVYHHSYTSRSQTRHMTGNILLIYEHLTQLSPVGHGCSLRQNPEATFLAGAVQILTTGEGSCKPAPPQISAVAGV